MQECGMDLAGWVWDQWRRSLLAYALGRTHTECNPFPVGNLTRNHHIAVISFSSNRPRLFVMKCISPLLRINIINYLCILNSIIRCNLLEAESRGHETRQIYQDQTPEGVSCVRFPPGAFPVHRKLNVLEERGPVPEYLDLNTRLQKRG